MTDAIILHASLRLPLACPPWHEPLLQALPYARRLELERRAPAARRASLAGLALALLARRGSRGRSCRPGFRVSPDRQAAAAGGPGFSLPHSLSHVACLVCADTDCGIDLEDLPEPADPATAPKLQRWTATEAA